MKATSLFLIALLCLLLPVSAWADFGLTTAADNYTVDTGAGLIFKVRRTDNGASTQSAGDLMSLRYNGVEYQDQARGSQLNSGFDYLYTGVSAVMVTGETVGSDYVEITVVAGNLTHYYLARRGYPHIYMATYFTTEPDTLGLCRYIVRVPNAVLPNGPVPSNILNNTGAIESADIFGLADGTTRSKHYSNMRLHDWSYIGATGTNVGLWIVRSNHEGDSGGPFYRSLLNQGASDQEITYILNYGEAQTEAFRTSVLNGPYTLVFTDGSAPPTGPALDTSWVADMGLVGFVGAPGRGVVTGSAITGRDTNYAYTVGFSNAQAQAWTDASPKDGSFTTAGMLPGTYTLSVYKNELVVYTQPGVVVTAGGTTSVGTLAINADPSQAAALWRIGNWDGSPAELLNGDKVTYMHPSDVRMSAWSPGPYVVGTSTPGTGMPCYQWKNVNANQIIRFNLTAAQVAASTVRVGITTAFAGGRPNVTVNSLTTALQGASTQPDTRTLTIGSYRGNNTTYTFNIPASALVVGTNTLTVYPISGSSGTTYLSPGYSLDCVELTQGNQTLALPAAPASLTASGGNAQANLSWTAVPGAAGYTVRRAAASGGPYAIVATGISTTSYTDATGLANGTPYYYVVSAANASGAGLFSSEASATPAPSTNAPVISSALSANAQVGQAFAYQISATSSPGSFDASGLPTGVSVDSATGLISGIPSAAGAYPVLLSATNTGGTGTTTLTLTVAAAPIPVPEITSLSAVSAFVGQPFSYQITATNSPTQFSATALPGGLNLNPATGLIAGTPTVAGTYQITLSATNSGGTGTGALTLTFMNGVQVPVVTLTVGGDGLAVKGGENGKAVFHRTGDVSSELPVKYVVKGTAKAGVDYVALTGTATFPAGSAKVKVKIVPIDNATVDGTRLAKVKLLPSTDGSYTLGATTVVKISVIDND